MNLSAEKNIYPYITSDPDIADNAPLIEGTRITVRTIAAFYQLGLDVDEILMSLSHLSAAQVHSALVYYFDHQSEIDNDLRNANDIDTWQQVAVQHRRIGE